MVWRAVCAAPDSGSGPCGRAKHTATLVGGSIWVVGGRGSTGAVPLKDCWRYCLESGRWERIQCCGAPPPALQEHTAVAYEGRLLVFGGEAACSQEVPLWILCTQSRRWRKVIQRVGETGPSGRRGHSAHGFKDSMLVYGGYRDLRGSSDDIWAFQYESEKWEKVRARNPGPARHRHASAIAGSLLYVHGGMCDLQHCGDLWCYDTESRWWRSVRSGGRVVPGALSGHAAARAGPHLYVFGGEDARGKLCDQLWRLHFATCIWERVETSLSSPAPRVDACALLVPRLPAPVGSAPPAPPSAPTAPSGVSRVVSRLSRLQLLGGESGSGRGAYRALPAGLDSTESLPRVCKSRSLYAVEPPAVTPATPAVAELVRVCDDPPLPKSASVRFTRPWDDSDEPYEWDTSDSTGIGHALTPDSGLGGGDIEMRVLRREAPRTAEPPPQLHLLVVGGREPAHAALLRHPLPIWTYRLL